MTKKCFLIIVLLSSLYSNAFSQQTAAADWHFADPKKDGHNGIGLQVAYDLLKGKKSKTIIVAVIDSGIDTLQSDLKPVLWKNAGEIPGNNIDDDKNDYVDDVHGWNFLGSSSGENLSVSVPEPYRTYHRFKKDFEGKKPKNIDPEKQYVFSEWKRAEAIINANYNDAEKEINVVNENFAAIHAANGILVKALGKATYKKEDLSAISSSGKDSVAFAKELWKNVFGRNNYTNEDFLKDFESYKQELDDKIMFKTTAPTDYRDKLLNNDGYDITTKYYGNNNLQAYSGYHGTSVSSIIGAVRGNNSGIDGIADNVMIMMIRAGLGKDEYDKDVALAIRYAVDNGAKLINISLGKPVSPDKKWVDDAMRYASEKDVLIVHAAGNDAQNIDVDYNYLNGYYIDGSKAENFINVAASGDKQSSGIVASFTNYGKKMVDIFAPGVDINCDIAGAGTQLASGTSMASPVVAGVAALIRSYFPELSASQVIEIIKLSGTAINENVILPGTDEKKVKFSELSSSGRIVNAGEAVRLALSGNH